MKKLKRTEIRFIIVATLKSNNEGLMSRYLKSMDIFGFKSFPNKTHIEFVDGITGIVGANGSGKSNVVESIKWVLGEQSAKTLRGEKMEDVIFNGTKERSSMGMAEVCLTFENENHWLPIEYGEVSIQRRIFRSGEGQYYINKSRLRLKDIVELFLDTGVGRDSYAIFEQGKIDRLLSESPLDRRVLFEEFAGISKFKYRREEAEKNLQKAQENLDRINDIMIGLSKEVESLELQAANAEKYNDLRNSLRNTEMRFEALRIQNFENEIMNKYSQKKKTEEKLAPLSSELKELEDSIAQTETEIQNREVEFNRIRDDYAKLQGSYGEVKSRIESNIERKSVLQKQLEGMATRLKDGEERERALKSELEQKSEDLDVLAEEKDEMNSVLLSIQSKIEDIHTQIRQLDQSALSRSRELGYERIVSKDDIEKNKRDLIQSQVKLDNYRVTLSDKFKQKQAIEKEENEKAELEASLQAKTKSLKTQLEEILAQIETQISAENRLKQDNKTKSEEIREMQTKLKSMDKIIMESLERQSVEIKEFTAKKPVLNAKMEESLRRLTDCIEKGAAVEETKRVLEELKLHFKESSLYYEKILGILYSDEGTYTQKEKTQERIEEISLIMTDNERNIEAFRLKIHELQSLREDIQNSYNKIEFELSSLQNEMKKINAQRDSAESDMKELEIQINDISNTIHKKQNAIETLIAIIDEYDDEMRELKAEKNRHYEELNKKKIDFARVEEKYISQNNEIKRIKNQLSDIERMKNSYQKDHESSLTTIDELEVRIQKDQKDLSTAENVIRDLKKDIEERKNAISDLQATRKAMELKRKSIEENIQKYDKVIFNLETIINEKKSYVETIISKSVETYGQDIRSMDIEHSLDLDTLTKQINQLRSDLQNLGDVNLLAIEQYHSAKERLSFLETQKLDTEKAMEDIRRLIEESNSKSIELFMTAFEDIRKAFKKIFARLFDGGKADLVLMDEKDILNTGINIFAEPPGKKFQSISLLSGGERALVAIAVIFAILYLKPTPFVVLDEIDAPLDDDNIDRFKALLHDFKQTSQFIIVSHSKSTLEICDALYGVTMEEQGVSKVINVAFDEANILFKTEEKPSNPTENEEKKE